MINKTTIYFLFLLLVGSFLINIYLLKFVFLRFKKKFYTEEGKPTSPKPSTKKTNK